KLRHVGELRGQVQAFERRYLRGDDAHHYRVGAALLEDVYAEARARGQRVAQVGRARVRETVGRVGVALHQGHRDDLGLVGRELLKPQDLRGAQAAVDLHLRRLADGKVQVADALRDLEHLLYDGRQVEVFHVRALGSGGLQTGA